MSDLADLIMMDEPDQRLFPADMAESVKLAHYANHIRYVCRHHDLGMPRVLGDAAHFQDNPGETVRLMVWPDDALKSETFFRVMDATSAIRVPRDEISFELVLPRMETFQADYSAFRNGVSVTRWHRFFLEITQPRPIQSMDQENKMAL